MSDNIIDEIIAQVSEHHKKLENLSPIEIKKVIEELKSEHHVWDKLASGNRNYLETALKTNKDNYYRGAIPHLKDALAHRLGFIASAEKQEDLIGDPVFDNVILERVNIQSLNYEHLVQFLRDFYNNEALRKLEKGHHFHNYRKTVEIWLDTHDRRRGHSVHEGKNYIETKRDKIVNLFVKTIFPQLMGLIAKDQV